VYRPNVVVQRNWQGNCYGQNHRFFSGELENGMEVRCRRQGFRHVGVHSERKVLSEVSFPDPVIGQHLGRRAGCDNVSLAHDVGAFANI